MRKLLVLLLVAFPALGAQLELGGRHLNMAFGGESDGLQIESGRGFGATAELFWTEQLSTQASITLVNPAATLSDGGIDLGTLGITTYAATARWHFAPAARFSPYVGGGGAFVQFGDLEDQNGDAIDVVFDDEAAFIGEAGVRFRARRRLFLDLGASYMPLDVQPVVVRSNAPFPETVKLDPWTVSISASWRF